MSKTNGDVPYYNLYINGQWRAPVAEQYRPTIDPPPATLGMIAQADIEDTRFAIAAARGVRRRLLGQHVARRTPATPPRPGRRHRGARMRLPKRRCATAAARGARPTCSTFPSA